jgi:hypothetical protein
MPTVSKASISSSTFMLPICAAKRAPMPPAMITAAIIGPISRTTDRPTRSATIDGGTVLLQLNRGLKCQDHAHQKADQTDNGQRRRPALLHLHQAIHPTKSGADFSPH